jgi:hypothetical protein
MLDLIVFNKEKGLPQPNLDELKSEYFLACEVRARTENVTSLERDLSRVIILRPVYNLNYGNRFFQLLVERGYFAYGRREDFGAIFDIYSPHSSVKSKFPPKALEVAVALFTMRLVQEGYGLDPYSIKFSIGSDHSEKK